MLVRLERMGASLPRTFGRRLRPDIDRTSGVARAKAVRSLSRAVVTNFIDAGSGDLSQRTDTAVARAVEVDDKSLSRAPRAGRSSPAYDEPLGAQPLNRLIQVGRTRFHELGARDYR